MNNRILNIEDVENSIEIFGNELNNLGDDDCE